MDKRVTNLEVRVSDILNRVCRLEEERESMKEIDEQFIKEVEKAHFRTRQDTGANLNALLIWNLVRQHVGLKRISREDLPGPTSLGGRDTLSRELSREPVN